MNTDTVVHPEIRVTSRHTPGRTVVAVEGEIDVATAASLRRGLLAEFDRAQADATIDLSGVSFCDATGLSVLVDVRRRARLLGISLTLADPRPPVRRLLQVTGLHRAFDVRPALDPDHRHTSRQPAA